MSSVLNDIEWPLGVVVLTVNRRLARFLVREHEIMQSLAGRQAWVAADILPWSAWLMRCWEELQDQWFVETQGEILPLLLTASQERLLWERIIADSPEGAGLLRIADAAQKARDAWNLLQAWELDLTPAEAAVSDDAAAWRRWADRFEAELARNHWRTLAALPTYLARHVTRLNLPRQIFLAGFDRITPQQEHLWQVLALAGVKIDTIHPAPMAGHAVRLAFPDLESEVRAAASWARQALELRLAAPAKEKPLVCIAVVIPGLAAIRPMVVRIFQEVFLPGEADHLPASLPYNLSLGIPLTETPLVRDALGFLELGRGRLDTQGYGRLLASPFLAGGQTEWGARGNLDARLRTDGHLSMTVEQLRQAGSRSGCPILATILTRFAEQLRLLKKEEFMVNTRQWAVRFDLWLQLLGWPGERGVDSTEYQVVASWQESLASFAALDRVSGRMGLSEALALLQRHMQETLFQPESSEAPVQILGMLEAQGEQFDGLWILGLSDDVWPPIPEPNPFLPVSMQRRHGLPKCSGEVELQFAKFIMLELLSASDEVIVSHSCQEGDRMLRLSPLATHLPEASLEVKGVECFPDYARMIYTAARREVWHDWRAPPFADEALVTGGAGVFKSQALCPFQAFARYRLRASGLENPQPGLDGRQRGELVHWALKQFWTLIDSSQALAALSPELWEERAMQAASEAVEAADQRWPDALSKSGKQLEQQRLLRLLALWSDLERSRVGDFVVAQCEAEMEFAIGGVRLTLRMDRVDRLPDGKLLILDYKTSKNKPSILDWFSARPREPQLPLYCLALADKTAGLSFARLFAQEVRFIGLVSEAGLLPGVATLESLNAVSFADWESLLAEWRGVFAELGRAFRAGDALPDALPGACLQCDLGSLCRIGDGASLDAFQVEEVL